MQGLTLQEQLNAIKTEMFVNKDDDKIKTKVGNNNGEYSRNNRNVHSNIEKGIVIDTKINYNEYETHKVNYNTEIRRPQRRELWYVNLGNPQGSLQKGVRPCLVDSNDINNKYSNIVNVYPLTSQMTKANIPVHIQIEGYGLKEKSIILIEQGVPIDIRFQLLSYIGTVDDLVMKKVDTARNIQHGDLQYKTLLERLPNESKKYIVNKIRFIKKVKETIEFLKSIKGDKYSISLAEDEMFREENSVKYYCDYNKIDYKEICKNFNELYEEKYDSIAL